MLDHFPILQTDRLDLIKIKQEHLKDIFKLFVDPQVTQYYNVVTLTKESDAQKFIDLYKKRFKDKLGIRWGISLKGTNSIIGTIGFNNIVNQHRATIGYDLQPNFWNNGYITEALQEVVDFGFKNFAINRIEAEVMQDNIASEKALTKLGFKKEGILRDWMYWNDKHYDMTMYSLLQSDLKS
jgi:ribosomal-protein-alanine N-acetyltransferase